MRFLRSIGWLLVLISTPAWAFLKMSFSSSRPAQKNILNCRSPAVNKPGGQSSTVPLVSDRARFSVTLFMFTSASIEDADAPVSAVVNLISSQSGVAVRLDPHSRHGVVKDLIVLDEAQTCYFKQQDLWARTHERQPENHFEKHKPEL